MYFTTETFIQRRKSLIELVKQTHGTDTGAIVLFAGLEHDRVRFRQESSFYYFTGITEPGVVLLLDLNGEGTLFIPQFATPRAVWVKTALSVSSEGTNTSAQNIGLQTIKYLGEPCAGYQLYPFFSEEGHSALIARLKKYLDAKAPLFSLNPPTAYGYVEQRWMLQRLTFFMPALSKAISDISPLVAKLRRKKDKQEIEALYKAVDITMLAQEGAAQVIAPGKHEYQVQAALEYVMREAGADGQSFPSIVGSGLHSTILHYTENNGTLEKGDLVVVDIGAEWNLYCADLTRTYPVSGKFTKRQAQVYNLVLDAQQYIAQLAKPGLWLSNAQEPEQSLNHLARAFLKKEGYDKYFPHGLGHFLGLDVHDVGDPKEPLAPGDVITIEPGIYIPEEKLGVRIEDNYWVLEDGNVCLSEHLPNSVEEIEAFVGKNQ
jgi:Xaa-Pro aminopeptidase